MLKRKDNLTDVVEQLPKNEVVNNPNPPKNQQVVGVDGEMITLGHKSNKTGRNHIKGKSFELRDIERMVKEAVKEEVDKLADKIVEKVGRKLKEKGLFE